MGFDVHFSLSKHKDWEPGLSVTNLVGAGGRVLGTMKWFMKFPIQAADLAWGRRKLC